MAQWALVTGASSGIGYELAKAYAEGGCDVVLCARRRDRLAALAAEIARLGRQAVVIPVDLGKRRAARKLAAALEKRGIAVDVLVNNAGSAAHGAFAALDPDGLDTLLAVNVRALTALTRQVLPGMLARGHGRILNVASIAAFQPVPGLAAYAASKAYVLSFSEALAEELRGSGVTVTAVCPGLTRTEMLSDLPDIVQSVLGRAADVQGAQVGATADAAGAVPGREAGPGPLGRLLNDAFMQDARTVAREGREACERGEVVRVTGWLNAWTAAWVEVQPRWLLRWLGGIAGRMVIARDGSDRAGQRAAEGERDALGAWTQASGGRARAR